MVGLISMGIMAAALFVVAARRVVPAIRLVAVQSLAVAILIMVASEGGWEPLVAAIVTTAIKGLAMPLILMQVVRNTGSRVGEGTIGLYARLLISAVLVVVVFRFAQLLGSASSDLAMTAAALGTLMLGLLTMLTKRLALMQVLGLIIIENGLMMVALSFTGPMPILVEMGMLFDALVGLIIMGVLIMNINLSFDSLDTRKMTMLKG